MNAIPVPNMSTSAWSPNDEGSPTAFDLAAATIVYPNIFDAAPLADSFELEPLASVPEPPLRTMFFIGFVGIALAHRTIFRRRLHA